MGYFRKELMLDHLERRQKEQELGVLSQQSALQWVWEAPQCLMGSFAINMHSAAGCS